MTRQWSEEHRVGGIRRKNCGDRTWSMTRRALHHAPVAPAGTDNAGSWVFRWRRRGACVVHADVRGRPRVPSPEHSSEGRIVAEGVAAVEALGFERDSGFRVP